MGKTIWVNGDEFILVEAESLSFEDEFMKYKPRTGNEYDTKELVSEAIRKGVKNFYRSKCDPSFTEDGKGIRFAPGNLPAVGKSPRWWEKAAREYCSERNSRLGTRLQYGAFLGVLIKKLCEEGKSVKWAWNAVCNDSKELGHYFNSEKSNHDGFELTGSRCICCFCDLANTKKIFIDDKNYCFCKTFGYYGTCGNWNPLATFCYWMIGICEIDDGVGWIVLS